MGAKLDQPVRRSVPGPGQYEMQNSPGPKSARAPAYSLGKGSRIDLANTKRSRDIPGPGLYKPSNTDKHTAPRYGFGSEIQRKEVAKTGRFATPAPGDYATKELMGKEGASITMGPLLHDKTKEKKDR